MKTIRTRLLTLVLVLTAVYCGAGRGTEAQAQQVVYPTYPITASQAAYYPYPVSYQIYVQRVYQTSWHWSPALGWHTHDEYVDVPYRVPVAYVYPQSWSTPVIATYSAQ